jgi:hypothetical protein
MPPGLFAPVILEIGSRFLPGPAWTMDLLFYTSHCTGITGVQHHTRLLVEVGSCELFSWAGLGTVIVLMSASQVVRVIGMSHQCSAFFGVP